MNMKIDKYSETWKAIEKYINVRIETYRDLLEHSRADESSEKIRGKLAFAREILELSKSQDA